MKSENKYFEIVPIELCQSKATIMYQSPSAVSPFLCHLTKKSYGFNFSTNFIVLYVFIILMVL